MKNYLIYSHEGKINRQAINLNDTYPESYAQDKIPSGADIIARIIQSDTVNKNWAGYRTKGLKSSWFKHELWTSYYPDDLTVEYKNATLFHVAQDKWMLYYIPLLEGAELELLQDSTHKALNRQWL